MRMVHSGMVVARGSEAPVSLPLIRVDDATWADAVEIKSGRDPCNHKSSQN